MTVAFVAVLALGAVAVAVVAFAAGYLLGVRDRLSMVQKELADLRREIEDESASTTAQDGESR